MSPLRPSPPRSLPLAKLSDLLADATVVGPRGDSAVVTGVTLDSRAVLPGDLYAALPGARTHGAKFAGQAVAAGAVAILTDPTGVDLLARASVPVLVVADPRAALGAVSALIYGEGAQQLAVVGLTGTNGKTTTAYLIHSALTALGHPAGLIGTVETRIADETVASIRTTPEAPDVHALLAVMAQRGLDFCVMEVSSHALRQHRVDGIRYAVAAFTNLSQDHLDFHADMEDYFAAKAELFTPARAARALVCVDDAWGRRLAAQVARDEGVPLTTVTTRPDVAADWTARVADNHTSRFTLTGRGLDGAPVELALASALPGDFNLANTALASVALLLLGLSPASVAAAVLTDPHVPGRMEVVASAPGDQEAPRVVVDYAHSPEAIRAALRALRPTTPGRLVVVTGAGGDRDRDKREAMGAAAAEFADLVVVTDDNPRSEDPALIRAAVRAGAQGTARARDSRVAILEVGDRAEAIRAAVAAARAAGPGATVAVLGKGHERGQEIAGQVHPFDDRVEARAALDATIAAPLAADTTAAGIATDGEDPA